jgi:hypothetical protein
VNFDITIQEFCHGSHFGMNAAAYVSAVGRSGVNIVTCANFLAAFAQNGTMFELLNR